MPHNLRLALYALAAVVLPFVALFVLIEAGFQISDALRTRPANTGTQWGVNVYDPDLLYRPRILPNPGPKGNQKRVVILGDSLIGGPRGRNLVDRSGRFANQDAKLPRSEWVSTGVPGYTNYQELAYLKKFGLPMQPDLVGVVFCLNDVHQYLADVKVVNGRLVGAGVTSEAASATQGWTLRLARRSLFLRWLKSKVSLARSVVDLYEKNGYDFDYRPDLSTAWQDAPWTMIRNQLREMRELANQYGFRLFVAVVPFAEQYRQDYLARDRNHVLKPQAMLAGITHELDIPFLDLYPSLDRGSFVPDRIHLNDSGQERAAAKIAEFLRTDEVLSAEPRTGP